MKRNCWNTISDCGRPGSTTPAHQFKSSCHNIDLHLDSNRIAVCEWKKLGRVENNINTDKLEPFELHHGVIRIHSLS